MTFANTFSAAVLSLGLGSSDLPPSDFELIRATAHAENHSIFIYGQHVHPYLNGDINPYHADDGFRQWNQIRDLTTQIFPDSAQGVVLTPERLCEHLERTKSFFSAQAELSNGEPNAISWAQQTSMLHGAALQTFPECQNAGPQLRDQTVIPGGKP